MDSPDCIETKNDSCSQGPRAKKNDSAGFRLGNLKISSGQLSMLFAVLFAVLLKPDIFDTLRAFGILSFSLQGYWNIIITAIAVSSFLVYLIRIHFDIFCGLVVLFVASIALSTLYNHQSLDYWSVYVVSYASISFIVAIFAPRYPSEMLWGMFFASLFYLILNIFSIWGWGEGSLFASGDILFYGHRNNTYQIGIPAFICSLLLDVENGKKGSIRTWAVFALAAIEVFVSYSATSAVAFSSMGIAVVVLIYFQSARNWLNALVELALYLLGFVGLVVLRLQKYASFFIEGVLNRNLTFTGRTAIWDKAMHSLRGSHMVTGRGTGYVINVDGKAFYAHNDILHILSIGGIFALLAYFGMLFVACRQLFVHRKNPVASCYVGALIPFFIVAITESVLGTAFFFILAMAYYQSKNLE